MLQLTFNALPPCPLFSAMAHDAYLALKGRDDARLRDACLSITLTDRGPSARSRYKVLFACLGQAGCPIRVVTESGDQHAALRSGFAVMLGSCLPSAGREPVTRHAQRPCFS